MPVSPHSRPDPDEDRDDADAPAKARAKGDPKLQRWVDLLAALLSHKRPATFEELAADVPAYGRPLAALDALTDPAERRTKFESLKRAFERDKDELRAFGVLIESLPDEDGIAGGAYRLRARDFYLPYLTLAAQDGAGSTPARIDKYGYRALEDLTFEPDELAVVVDAYARVRALGDPRLVADVDSAMRKLAVDLPVGALSPSAADPILVLPKARASAEVFAALSDALVRKKRVRFAYHAMSTDRTEDQHVEPYGLAFVNGHWYMIGHIVDSPALRHYRLNRIVDVWVNPKTPQTPDYDVGPWFKLREHVGSRRAWELGDGDPTWVVVEFRGTSGPAHAAMRLGRPVARHEMRRAFQVKRPEAFVRWILSFAGEAIPVSPPEIVSDYRAQLERIAALYASGPPPESDASPAVPAAESSVTGAPRAPLKGAAVQLARILRLVPAIADGEEHDLAEVAERVGAPVETVQRDLYSLVMRFDDPGGFVEGVQIGMDGDRVWVVSNHFARPMRLTRPELSALELGIALLAVRRPPDEQAVLERTRDRLRAVLAKLPSDEEIDGPYGALAGTIEVTPELIAVRSALRERRTLRLAYRKSGAEDASDRVVRPYALVESSGTLYLIGQDEQSGGLRNFRLDRIERATLTDESFEIPPDFSVDEVLRDGKVLRFERSEAMRVRYTPTVARWIAEREGVALEKGAELVLDHPLADWEWGLRHVLRPVAMRERLRERVASMLAAVAAQV